MDLTFEPQCRASDASWPELEVGWISPLNLSVGPVVPHGLNWGLGGSHLCTSVQGQWCLAA